MQRDTVTAVLQLVGTMRSNLDELRQIVEEEPLPVTERSMIEHAIAVLAVEIDAVSQALSGKLTDPSKIQ